MILCICPNPAIDKFIMVDNFGKGNVNRAIEEQSFPGGKGVHVALGVRELGEDVALLAFWGGPTGQWIKQECESKGIECFGPDVKGWARTCLTIKSSNEFNETELLGIGPVIGENDFTAFLMDYEHLLKYSDVICMSGSWPKNLVDANYSQLIEKASLFNIKSFIDCSGNILIDALEKSPYAVHINHHEGYDIYKSNDPVEISLKLGSHCNIAIITYGEKGLYIYDGKELVHALSKVENVISAVGSGDSLMAGLVVAHYRGYDLIETAKLTASCGAANCIREDLGMFYKKDVELLLKSCEVKFKN